MCIYTLPLLLFLREYSLDCLRGKNLNLKTCPAQHRNNLQINKKKKKTIGKMKNASCNTHLQFYFLPSIDSVFRIFFDNTFVANIFFFVPVDKPTRFFFIFFILFLFNKK